MSEQSRLKPLAIALGATFASALSLGTATAAENPFGQSELSSGYMVAENETVKPAMEGKCGEGKCGAGMKKPAAEGMCGGMKSGDKPRCDMKTLDADGDGTVSKEEFEKHHNEMFSKMDANNDGTLDATESGKITEGKCGGAKTMTEGKCGEGKCGAGMKK